MTGPVNEMLVTMTTALAAGVVLTAVARRVRLSAIALLLLGGVALGPDGIGLVHTESLGLGLRVIVSISVGLILFEGGLTLDVKGYRSASRVILRLLTVGVLVTWLATAIAVHLIFDFPLDFSLLAASLVIVTGPTVIVPLLNRIRCRSNLHAILHWEGVLIDPIGVFIALLCFEWFTGSDAPGAIANFGWRLLVGLGVGGAGGLLLGMLTRSHAIPEDESDLVSLAFAITTFTVAESISPESGLLATTAAGFILGLMRPSELKVIRHFKSRITSLLIGTLFVLLAARLRIADFAGFGMRGLMLVLVVMLVVRPLNILVSTVGESLKWRERIFLAWVAPRGIVAASLASVFALSLAASLPNSEFLETFTFSVIVVTVLLQGFTAGLLARFLGVQERERRGWLIIGAHRLGREIGAFIRQAAKVNVVMVDMNARAVRDAYRSGLSALRADARDALALEESPDLVGVGNILAITDNEDLNALLCQIWAERFGASHVFRWRSTRTNTSGEDGHGTAILDQLPKPSLLSGELDARRSLLALERVAEPAPGPAQPPADGSKVIATALGEEILFGERQQQPKPGTLRLRLQRAPAGTPG